MGGEGGEERGKVSERVGKGGRVSEWGRGRVSGWGKGERGGRR